MFERKGVIMRIREGFVVKEIAGQYVVVALGAASKIFNGIIMLNETGKFIWELMAEGIEKEDLLAKFMAEYNVSEAEAKEDIRVFIQTLLDNGIAEL